ncbi:hypothetical protein PMIN01_00017 [Paraphaeosphaeria minitans]|uniref:Uncharacterized protein n=1 Tax=Paraphaeosphaeria minitans TaxID=565426 RepID=A0A9P6GS18_9PLEO|nr:hypothetical protein PMIN01_00017 [Paraphaeosphaeria minitans]
MRTNSSKQQQHTCGTLFQPCYLPTSQTPAPRTPWQPSSRACVRACDVKPGQVQPRPPRPWAHRSRPKPIFMRVRWCCTRPLAPSHGEGEATITITITITIAFQSDLGSLARSLAAG